MTRLTTVSAIVLATVLGSAFVVPLAVPGTRTARALAPAAPPVAVPRPQVAAPDDDEPERVLSSQIRALSLQDRLLLGRLLRRRAAVPLGPAGVVTRPGGAAHAARRLNPATLRDTGSPDPLGQPERAGRVLALCLVTNGNVVLRPGGPTVCGRVMQIMRLDRTTGTIIVTMPPRAGT